MPKSGPICANGTYIPQQVSSAALLGAVFELNLEVLNSRCRCDTRGWLGLGDPAGRRGFVRPWPADGWLRRQQPVQPSVVTRESEFVIVWHEVFQRRRRGIRQHRHARRGETFPSDPNRDANQGLRATGPPASRSGVVPPTGASSTSTAPARRSRLGRASTDARLCGISRAVDASRFPGLGGDPGPRCRSVARQTSGEPRTRLVAVSGCGRSSISQPFGPVSCMPRSWASAGREVAVLGYSSWVIGVGGC